MIAAVNFRIQLSVFNKDHPMAVARRLSKAVRLFLTWARETGVIDVDELLAQYPVRSGSASRWMSRLDDGTLLSLNPHG